MKKVIDDLTGDVKKMAGELEKMSKTKEMSDSLGGDFDESDFKY
jgi:hypothetical protein